MQVCDKFPVRKHDRLNIDRVAGKYLSWEKMGSGIDPNWERRIGPELKLKGARCAKSDCYRASDGTHDRYEESGVMKG
jgi:hypothetical protein